MSTKLRTGLSFAALGYAVVVAIGMVPVTANLSAVLLLCLAPVLFLTATVDPSWMTLLSILAPLDAALYAAVAITVRYLLDTASNQREDRASRQ